LGPKHRQVSSLTPFDNHPMHQGEVWLSKVQDLRSGLPETWHLPQNHWSSRYRIGPVEVENALAEHPAVAESAVVSSPDSTRGEVRSPVFVCLCWKFPGCHPSLGSRL
jgi:hypothetical protein